MPILDSWEGRGHISWRGQSFPVSYLLIISGDEDLVVGNGQLTSRERLTVLLGERVTLYPDDRKAFDLVILGLESRRAIFETVGVLPGRWFGVDY